MAAPESPWTLSRCFPHSLCSLPPHKPFLYACMPASVFQLPASPLHELELALNPYLCFQGPHPAWLLAAPPLRG